MVVTWLVFFCELNTAWAILLAGIGKRSRHLNLMHAITYLAGVAV